MKPFRGVSAPASLKHVDEHGGEGGDFGALSGALAPRPH